ncbi:BTAD domain-containing putative transcriptional regulator [Micromonospora sp. NPDC005806]|uniref:BTAD domain-containing putative transcriptional regulator n=1 Tax=Micromonospora sp. NPDC005806 TaxID=3364234 RepID=UPI0036C6B800
MSGTKVPPGGPAGTSPPAPSQLRFEVLGPQQAWYADRPLDLGPGKQRAVLAVLLLSAGRPVPTGQIVDAVWPEDPPANGPNVVQKYVAGLRRVLEPDRSPRTPGQVLTLTDAGYLLRIPPEALDAVRFERGVHRARQRHAEGRTDEALAEVTGAVELWQGEPFTGFAGPYFETARHRLVELRAVALETRAELALASGRHRELVGELVELVAEFPVRERLRHQLMLALYRSGRQAEALAAYREFARLLREEYGIEPGEVLQELHGRILRSDSTLHPATELPTQSPGPARTGPTGTVAGGTGSGPVAAIPAPARTPVPAAAPAPAEAPVPTASSSVTPDQSVPPGLPPAYGAPPVFPPPVAARLRPRRAPRWLSITGTVLGLVATVLTFGFLTWLVLAVYAAWRRSWRTALAAIWYLGLVVGFVWAFADLDSEAEATDLEMLSLLGLIIAWIGGALHVLLLNRGVWAVVTGRRDRRAEDRRLLREQARFLLHHHPAARFELRIGRPDLPRTFDDGGLIDINAVSGSVIGTLPGLTTPQYQQLIMDRWLRGPYTSMEDLAARCMLPPTATDALREILVFLPPWA